MLAPNCRMYNTRSKAARMDQQVTAARQPRRQRPRAAGQQPLPAAQGQQQHQQLQVEQGEQGSTTCFTDLPDAVLGLIWARLDRPAQLAFVSSCRAVWASPSINATIQELDLDMFTNTARAGLRKLRSFPRHATLRRLSMICMGSFWRFLTSLLQDDEAQAVLQGLRELEIQVRCRARGMVLRSLFLLPACAASGGHVAGCSACLANGWMQAGPDHLVPPSLHL